MLEQHQSLPAPAALRGCQRCETAPAESHSLQHALRALAEPRRVHITRTAAFLAVREYGAGATIHALVLAVLDALGRNEKKRPRLEVNNAKGRLDAYVVQYDQPERFRTPEVKRVWNALAKRMHALMPGACARVVELLERSGVRERLISADACQTCSDDLLVNNVGVSSRYQSPAHCDKKDLGWTYAFSVKCCWGCRL